MKTYEWTLAAIAIIVALLLLFVGGGSHHTKTSQAYGDIQGLEMRARQYKDDIGNLPPVENKAFFQALGGNNKLHWEYVNLKDWKHDAEGRYLDVWEQPYFIEISNGEVHVHSLTLDRDPLKE